MSGKKSPFKASASASVKRARQWFEAKLTLSVLALLQLLPMNSGINVNAKIFEIIGPLLPRQKVVLSNLIAAYPEKSSTEIRKIAREMWRNMGKLVAEYVFIDRLFDYDPNSKKAGLIEIQGREIIERIIAEGKPVIFFTGHIGNFELLPICAATFGLEVTALFRPPNNPYISKHLLSARQTATGSLVPSKAGAAWGLMCALENGKSIGILVDQKFHAGISSKFFGLPVRTNPLAVKLARHFNAPMHPIRCIRLAGGRFKLILEDAIKIPLDNDNRMDMDSTIQLLNDKVEKWVRQTPEQWMWMHRRFDYNENTPRRTLTPIK